MGFVHPRLGYNKYDIEIVFMQNIYFWFKPYNGRGCIATVSVLLCLLKSFITFGTTGNSNFGSAENDNFVLLFIYFQSELTHRVTLMISRGFYLTATHHIADWYYVL